MSIDLMKVYIKCPCCGFVNEKFDYHENESSERSEYFNVTGSTGNIVCESCKFSSSFDSVFDRGCCEVESVDKYVSVFKRQLSLFAENGRFYFSDYDPSVSEHPAIDRLCKLYPQNSELRELLLMYGKVRAFGKKMLTKLETNAFDVERTMIYMPSVLDKVYLHDGVRIIGDRAFSDCVKLTDIFVPDSVRSIGKSAFSGCDHLKTVHLPSGLTEISDGMFKGCNCLAKCFIPDGVESIGDDAFNNCISMNSPWIPSGLKRIGNRAFWGCKNVKRIVIPFSVGYIGEDAFGGCPQITIVGEKGSVAEKYAMENGIEFSVK